MRAALQFWPCLSRESEGLTSKGDGSAFGKCCSPGGHAQVVVVPLRAESPPSHLRVGKVLGEKHRDICSGTALPYGGSPAAVVHYTWTLSCVAM